MNLLILLIGLSFSLSNDLTSYVWSDDAVLNNGVLTTNGEVKWRILENGPEHFDGSAVILTRKGSHSGVAYFGGKNYSVTLIGGEPEYAEGFRTILLLTDTEQRRLTFTDGTTRRVLDPEADLDFPGNSLVEIIITRDRRYAIDLSRGMRIAVSPPLRN